MEINMSPSEWLMSHAVMHEGASESENSVREVWPIKNRWRQRVDARHVTTKTRQIERHVAIPNMD